MTKEKTTTFSQPVKAQELCTLLECRYPIVQAGMGGVAQHELVTAVANSGGYGCLGMVREPPAFIAQQIDQVRATTDNSFSVNLIPAATDPRLLDEQLHLCFEKKIHSVSLFWDVDVAVVAKIKTQGLLVLHQVGSITQAVLAVEAGVDVIVAQGFEAGGHVNGGVSSLVLLPQIARAVGVPVVAAGGFASGDALVAAWALGAAGIQCGTGFLATRESFAHEYHKQRILAAASNETLHTKVFSINWPPNAPVRVLHNSVTDSITVSVTDSIQSSELPPTGAGEPIAHNNGVPVLRASTDSPLRTTTGELEALALYAGEVAGRIDTLLSVDQRIQEIITSSQVTLATLNPKGVQPMLPNDHEPLQQDREEPREYASPVCYQHEFDNAASQPLAKGALLSLLNELLEGERAGAQGLIDMQRDCADPELKSLVTEVAQDEGRFCTMLSMHIRRLGEKPSNETGVFLDKLKARKTLHDKFVLLDRGQSAVVHTLNLALPKIEDPALHRDFTEMRDVHIQNIKRCALLAGLESS